MTAASIVLGVVAAALCMWRDQVLRARVRRLTNERDRQAEALVLAAAELEVSIRRGEPPAPGVKARELISAAVAAGAWL